jgi:hypothetical protein
MSTTFDTGPLLDELAAVSAEQRSTYKAIGLMAAKGKLGALAKELAELADDIAKSAYVPPAAKADHHRYQELAKSVTDRELARFYRDKAAAARSQMGEQ